MKKYFLITFLILNISCIKDKVIFVENKDAIIKESSEWIYFSKNHKLDSAISKLGDKKIIFFYKDILIDSFVEYTKYQKNDNSFFMAEKNSHKFIYNNNKLIEEKVGLFVYDYNKDSFYKYNFYPYNKFEFIYLNDSTVEELINKKYKRTYFFKNKNLVKYIDTDGNEIINEYDDRINPFSNFIGLEKIYYSKLLSNYIEIYSKNNVIKRNYNAQVNSTIYSIEYNNFLNPSKIKIQNNVVVEELIY